MTDAPGREAEGVAVSMYVPGGHAHGTASQRQNLGEQLRQRREESRRHLPLPDGRRDPLEPIRENGPAGVGELDAWARALAHLQGIGLAGLPPAHVRRALAALPERYGSVLPRRSAA